MAWKQKLAELLVEIKAPLGPLKSAMSKAAAIVKRGMRTMSRWARRGAIAIGVGLAAALTWATKKAMVQEDAEIDLAAALKKTGDATQENIDRLKKYAAELQKTTIYGDEETLSQMAYAKNLGVTTDKLEEAAKAAIGLAATYKLDLKAAMMLVGRASQGQTQMLTRYGIVLREGLADQEKFNEVLRIGAEGFVLAEEKAKGTRGILTRLWNVIGDIAEVIASPLLKRLREAADGTLEWVKANKELIETRVGEWIDKLVLGLEKLKPALAFTAKHWKVLIGIFSSALFAPAIAAIGKIIALLSKATIGAVIYGTALIKIATKGKLYVKALQTAVRMVGPAVTVLGRAVLKLVNLWQGIVSITMAIGSIIKAMVLSTAALVAGIAVIAAEVVLIIHAFWRMHSAKKKIRAHEKAASKEEIEEYKKKVRAIKDETAETRKAAKEAAKKAAAEAKAKKRLAEEAKLIADAKAAEIKAIEDAAAKEAELEKKRQDGIDKLEKQLEMYKEMTGYQKEMADIEEKLQKERAREIGKELSIGGVDVLDNIKLKALREIEQEQKRIADEAAQAAKDKRDEQRSLYKDELSTLEALFTDSVGYEKELKDVKKRIRKEEAKDIAAATKVSYEDAMKILEAKVAIASVKIGMVGFEQAWSQIAAGASQTEKEIAKATRETAKHTKTIAEKTTIIANKDTGSGFGP